MSVLSEPVIETIPHAVSVARSAAHDVPATQHTDTNPQRGLVLIVDDDTVSARLLERSLQLMGYEVMSFASAEAVLAQLPHLKPAAICLDIMMPGMSGLQALPLIRQQHPATSVIMVSSETNIDGVVTAMRDGAFDYICKPADRDTLAQRVAQGVTRYHVQREIAALERSLEGLGLTRWVGQGSELRSFLFQVDQAARSAYHALIRAERPEARICVARAVHAGSARRSAPFVDLDAADPGQHAKVRGILAGLQAGPGNDPANVGALGGTVFVDRVEALKKEEQAMLLGAIRLRHEPPGKSGLRVLGASAIDLIAEVEQGRFAAELLRYLSAHQLNVPSRAGNAHDKGATDSQEVRMLSEQAISLDDLERHAIEAALKRTRGNVTRAMRQLGIGRTTLYRKLKKYGLR